MICHGFSYEEIRQSLLDALSDESAGQSCSYVETNKVILATILSLGGNLEDDSLISEIKKQFFWLVSAGKAIQGSQVDLWALTDAGLRTQISPPLPSKNKPNISQVLNACKKYEQMNTGVLNQIDTVSKKLDKSEELQLLEAQSALERIKSEYSRNQKFLAAISLLKEQSGPDFDLIGDSWDEEEEDPFAIFCENWEEDPPIQPRPEPVFSNTTSAWLHKNLSTKGSRYMKAMRVAILRKCPTSAKVGKADDHIQEYLLKLIRRDGLRRRLEKNLPIPPSLLASYAVRSAFTDIRDAATEPVERQIYGAKTERERKGGDPFLGIPVETQVIWSTEENQPPVSDISDETFNPFGILDTNETFDKLWNRTIQEMQKQKPHAWQRYIKVLRMSLEGYSTREIAQEENVSAHRAASILQTARRTIRDNTSKQEFFSCLD